MGDNNLGYQFTPGLANRFKAATNNNNPQLPVNATQALQILSLHLPDVLSGAAVAPDALLRGTPGPDPAVGIRAMTGGIPASSPVRVSAVTPSPSNDMKTPTGVTSTAAPPPSAPGAPSVAPQRPSITSGSNSGAPGDQQTDVGALLNTLANSPFASVTDPGFSGGAPSNPANLIPNFVVQNGNGFGDFMNQLFNGSGSGFGGSSGGTGSFGGAPTEFSAFSTNA